MLVVERSFLIVKEDIIGLGDSFEFYFGLRSVVFGNFVRVMRKCGLLDLLVKTSSMYCRIVESARNLKGYFCSVPCALH